MTRPDKVSQLAENKGPTKQYCQYNVDDLHAWILTGGEFRNSFDIPEEAIAFYEWVEQGKGYWDVIFSITRCTLGEEGH